MNKILKLFLAVLVVLAVTVETFAGGGNRTGTGGAAQLLIPFGARGIAMGGSNVATTTGVEALYFNPAGSAKYDHSTTVNFSHMNYIADIGVEHGAISTNVDGFGTLSFNLKSLSVGEIPVTTVQDPDGTGKMFTPQFLTAGLTYARQLTDRISVGTTVNLTSESLGDVKSSGVAFNVGLIYSNLADFNGLSFGIVMKNIGPQQQFEGPGLYREASSTDFKRPPSFLLIESAPYELPSTFELGFGYAPKIDNMNSLLLNGSFTNNNFSGDEYKLGLEYGYSNTFFVRAGYVTSPKSQASDYLYGFSAGAGLNYDMEGIGLEVGYAFRDVKYFGANHVFEINIGF